MGTPADPKSGIPIRYTKRKATGQRLNRTRVHTNRGIREVIDGSYRIIYRIKEEQIDGLAVMHSA